MLRGLLQQISFAPFHLGELSVKVLSVYFSRHRNEYVFTIILKGFVNVNTNNKFQYYIILNIFSKLIFISSTYSIVINKMRGENMKFIKELGFRFFVVLVMLGLVFVANDMSNLMLLKGNEIFAQDIFNKIPPQLQRGILDFLLPLGVYFASIGGFFYLLIDDYKLLKTFSQTDKLAKYVWSLWIIILICLIMVPIFFGLHLLVSGFALAIITTAVFLIILGILYRLR